MNKKQLTKKQVIMVCNRINECIDLIIKNEKREQEYSIYYNIGYCSAIVEQLTEILKNGYNEVEGNMLKNDIEGFKI